MAPLILTMPWTHRSHNEALPQFDKALLAACAVRCGTCDVVMFTHMSAKLCRYLRIQTQVPCFSLRTA